MDNFNIMFILNKKIEKKFKFIRNYKNIYLPSEKYINFVFRWFILFFLNNTNNKQFYFCPNIYSPIIKMNFKIINLFHDSQWLKYPENFSFVRKIWIKFNILLCKINADQIIFTSKYFLSFK